MFLNILFLKIAMVSTIFTFLEEIVSIFLKFIWIQASFISDMTLVELKKNADNVPLK